MSNIDNVKTGVFEYEGENYTFNYYTDLDISKKVSFVNGVVDTLVTENHYQSILRSIIFGFQLVNVFSDALSLIGEEEKTFSLVEIEDIVMNTKIVDIILANVKEGLIDELNEAVNRDIEYKTGIHKNVFGEAVASLLGTLEQRVKDIDIDSLMGFANVVKNIPAEDMTPEKLWDAYADSKAFKKVQDEAVKQSNKVIKLTDEVAKQPKKRGRKPKAKKTE